MKYLVTGATGDIGSRVTRILLERGERPRIFARNRETAAARFGNSVDIAVGDLSDAVSLRPALEGIDALFLVNSGPELARRDKAAADVAKAAGVTLVKLSSMDAQQDVGTGVWHAQGEGAIRASGIRFTFVQPTGFMSNALFWAPAIKAHGILRSATGDGRIPFIHSDDIAAVCVKALTSPDYDSQSLPITGPEALNYAEMTAKIGAAIAKPLKFESLSLEEESRQMAAEGESPEMIAAHISIYRAIREGRLATVTCNVERVLGRKPIAFDQWARENASAFL
jgi:(4-alkanoyl-5-oxo-2,5-dihydrofuran-3-yl)methyl phosphate reductase